MGNLFRQKTGAALLLLTALFSIPFAGQAFHIDDRLYLEVAEHALEKPFFPYDFPLLFEGLESPDGASHSHLPLTVYYMAFIMLLTGGEQEWVFHLFFMVFPLTAAFSFHDLARRYVANPMLATFLLLASPAFLTLGHNLMTDVPLLAFWVLAMSRYMRIIEREGSRKDMAVLGTALLCSAFISMLTMGLAILLASGLVMRRYPGLFGGTHPPTEQNSGEAKNDFCPPVWAWWLVLLLPVILWTAWYGRAWLHYDRLVLANTLMHMGQRETLDLSLIGTKLLSFFLNTGGIFFFPLLVWAVPRKGKEWLHALVILACSLAAPFLFLPDWMLIHKLLFSLFLSSGLLLADEVVRHGFPLRSKDLLLSFWFFGIMAVCLVLFYSGSARYVLLALPPALLIIIKGIESRFESGKPPRIIPALLVASTLVYSVPVSYADYEFAEAYRAYTKKLSEKYQSPERTVWYTGEWGFRYYMEQNGTRIMARNDRGAEAGDIIIKPYIASPWVTLYDGGEYTRLVEQVPVEVQLPLRILDFSSHAGFYSSGWGLLPVSWKSGKHWEWFNVYEVIKEYSGPVPESERHW